MKKNLLFFFVIEICFISSGFSQNIIHPEKASEFSCGPIPAVCYPYTTGGGLGIGIYFVGLNLISKASGLSAILEDYTCTDSTWLNIGVSYNFEVHTGPTYEETVTAWIDFSNDGSFDPSEIVYHDSAFVFMHQGLVTVPVGAVNSFTPIRMRVGSEYSGNTPLTSCNNALYGEYEDYTIYYGAGIGVNETSEQDRKTLITPNPFHTSALLQIPGLNADTQNCTLDIYDCVGELVRSEVFKNQPTKIIYRNDLPAGLYFYELRTDSYKQVGNGKLVIE
jgi:hypothetical protein